MPGPNPGRANHDPGGTRSADALLDRREERLSNGLTLLPALDHTVSVFTIMLWVPAGRRTEPNAFSGIPAGERPLLQVPVEPAQTEEAFL